MFPPPFDRSILPYEIKAQPSGDPFKDERIHGRRLVAVLYSSLPPRPPAGWNMSHAFDVQCLKPMSVRDWAEVLGSLSARAKRAARTRT